MRKFNVSFLALAALAVSAQATFDVGNNPDFDTLNGFYSDSLASGPDNFWGQHMGDTFTLDGAPSFDVQSIVFWGYSENFLDPLDLSNVASFEINIWDLDGLGLPSTLSASYTLPTASLGVEEAFEIDTDYHVYKLTADVSGLSLDAGSYGLSVGANLVEPWDNAFVWLTSAEGDNSIFGIVYGADDWGNWLTVADRNLAFRVQGEAVPEPMTMAVLGGLALVAARRRKKA